MIKFLLFLLLIALLSAIWVLFTGQIDFHANWQTANRASAGLAPNPNSQREGIIQVYSARAFSWRGIFSVHTWIVVKAKNASSYTVYQVVGWRTYQGLPALSSARDVPDRYWFDQKPKIILDLRGAKAEILIPKVTAAAKAYPYPNYELWPGPNSNTLPAYIGRQVPELGLVLPANAIGKDFLPLFTFFAAAPSGTGYQFSILGMLSIMLAEKEGLEINLLGLVYGISPSQHAIKLPCIGEIYWR